MKARAILAAVAAFALALSSEAATEKVGDYTWTYRVVDGGAEIWKDGGGGYGTAAVSPAPSGTLTIPSTLGGKTVTAIGESAFYGCTGITGVAIPDSVKTIGESAFSGCTGLRGLTIPAGVATVDYYAFQDCAELKVVKYLGSRPTVRNGIYNGTPSDLMSFVRANDSSWDELLTAGMLQSRAIYAVGTAVSGDYVFSYRYRRGEVEIVKYEDDGSHASAVSPKPTGAVTVPGTINNMFVTRIGEYAFWGCDSMTSVIVQGPVESIGDCAFAGCSSLLKATYFCNCPTTGDNIYIGVPLGFVSLVRTGTTGWDAALAAGVWQDRRLVGAGPWTSGACTLAFDGCVLTVSGNGNMEDYDFGGDARPWCGGLNRIERVVVEAGVKSIGDWAFYRCPALATVEIPDGVTRIGGYAFKDCTSLAAVTIPSSVTSIGNDAFHGCTAVTDVNCYADPAALAWDEAGCDDFKAGKGTKIHVGASQLAAYQAKFGSTVNATFVGDLFDSWTSGDCTVTLDASYTLHVSGSGAMADYPATHPPWYPVKDLVKRVVIEKGVTTVGDYSFVGCSALADVAIPSSVTSIGKAAFSFCRALVVVTISDGVTLIDEDAFATCALVTLTIPASVTKIERNAFRGCTRVTDVYCRADPNALMWNDYGCDDFKADRATKIHVKSSQLEAYQSIHGGFVNATFVGDLTDETFKVTFGKNGGTGGDSYVTATYGAAMPTPRTAPKKDGYVFDGYWDTTKDGGKQYYDGSMKSVRSWDKKAATTLWAKWVPARYKVTFGKNGGTGGDDYVTVTYTAAMPTPRTAPKKSGYIFEGYWNTTGENGICYYDANMKSAHVWDKTSATTLWAKWRKAAVVKVTFGKNGGSGGDNYVTCTEGQPMPTPRTAPTRAGWTFAGYWDTLAQDANGNPLGKQYYDASMKSVRNWDKTSAVTLWAKWTVRVKLGKNGGTGGDDYVTVTYNQPFPKRTMPKKSGYAFGGYWVSASSKTGQCYNPDGTGTSSMKWSTGGTPTIWALWTKTSSLVEVAPPTAAPIASAAPAAAEPAAIPAGLYSGVLADGTGTFWLMLDEPEEGRDRTAYLYVASEGGVFTAECTAEEAGGALLLTTEDGEVYAFDPAAGTLTGN